MDYRSHLEKAKQDLAALTTQKAVLEEKIKGLVESLGLDPSQELTLQIEALGKELEQKKVKLSGELEEILRQLEELNV